jgi:SAM-dependent methyltransferase
MKYDLGCGAKKLDGFIGVDKEELPGVDIVADLNNKLPIKSDSADEINAMYIVEHVRDLDFTMNEIWRICKNGAIVTVGVPHFSGNIAYYEYHNRFFNIYSFQDWGGGVPRMVGKNNGKFIILERKIIFPKFSVHILGGLWEKLFNINFRTQKVYDETFLHWLFPAVAIHFKLEAIKS